MSFKHSDIAKKVTNSLLLWNSVMEVICHKFLITENCGYSNILLPGSLDKKLFDENDFVSPIDQFNLIWNIAKGVYHLHENRIIHRDLAARNILLSHGVPKISVIITVRHQFVTDLTLYTGFWSITKS
jgi:serine/threonine protein kinase